MIRYLPRLFVRTLLLSAITASGLANAGDSVASSGIRFSCAPGQLGQLELHMDAYFGSLGIPADLILRQEDEPATSVTYTLNTPLSDTSTLTLSTRPEMHVEDETVMLPVNAHKLRAIKTVSKKEIVLALLQHGRLTEFKGAACTAEALVDHVAIRQNMVAWAENLDWDWTDGGYAKWNRRYWHKGTPNQGVSVQAAVNDIFWHQAKYSFGCYTATKLVVVQGVLDYYSRIKKDKATTALINARLDADKDPLVSIEPGKMWAFEPDASPTDVAAQGKLATIISGVAPDNFVPGDWGYILNTDPISSQKTGYEGSNAVYLGRNKFDDYYNDNHHAYTYQQKVDEVYQWRYGVFSRSRDTAKIHPLTATDIKNLSRDPSSGGIVLNTRVFPYYFGYESLPEMK